MANALYISSVSEGSGKFFVALGLVDLAVRQMARVGFYRPVITARPDGAKDRDIEIMRSRFDLEQSYAASYAWTFEEARSVLASEAGEDRLVERVIERFKALERRCDFIIIEGSDYIGDLTSLEFDLNALIARNLSIPLVLVGAQGAMDSEAAIDALKLAVDAAEARGVRVRGVALNKVRPEGLAGILGGLHHLLANEDRWVTAFPFIEDLRCPSLAEVAAHLDAHVLMGKARVQTLVRTYLVGGMLLEAFLSRLAPHQLVIIPGDRADLILAAIEADRSAHFPPLAGVVLVSGMGPSPEILQLIEGLENTLPVLISPFDMYAVAVRLERIQAGIGLEETGKVDTALAAFDRHADIGRILRDFRSVQSAAMTPRMFTYGLMHRARSDRRRIVLAEGEEPRILKAAHYLMERELVDLTLIGCRDRIARVVQERGITLQMEGLKIVNPAESPDFERYAEAYQQRRALKGVTLEMARDLMLDVGYFATLMVHLGDADGMVSGAVHTTQETIRPALQCIGMREGFSLISSVFFMCLEDGVLVYGDCAINPEPDPHQLAEIAASAADTARAFGLSPRVAMLSYSSGDSGSGSNVDAVRHATQLAKAMRPDIEIEGPIQYDAAVDPAVAALKMPGSGVAGRANVLIFPDLNTGNNTYKAVQRETGALAIGPILQGLKKPVNDLSRGCTVEDIINTVIITAIQSQAGESAIPRMGQSPQ